MDKEQTIKLSKEDLENLVAAVSAKVSEEKLDAKIKELGLDKVDRKFNGSAYSDDELSKMDKKQKVANFIKAVYEKDKATIKALSEGTGSEGGFQVPEEFAAELNRIAEDFGLVRRFARKITMSRDVMNVPRLGSSVSVTYPGENTAGSESEPVWENVVLTTKTAVGLTVMSNELLEDANVDIVDTLAELFAEALSGSEDEQGLVGTGSPFTGILEDAGVNVVTMGATFTAFTDVTLDDLRDMISQIKPLALGGASFTMHRSIWGIIQKLKDGQDGYHISAANPVLLPGATEGRVGGVVVGSIWGYPVYLSEKMPDATASAADTKFIIFGNYRHLWFGDRKQMALSVSDSATVGTNNTFEQNQSAVRVTERYALAVGLPKAFAVLKTAAA